MAQVSSACLTHYVQHAWTFDNVNLDASVAIVCSVVLLASVPSARVPCALPFGPVERILRSLHLETKSCLLGEVPRKNRGFDGSVVHLEYPPVWYQRHASSIINLRHERSDFQPSSVSARLPPDTRAAASPCRLGPKQCGA